MNGWRVMRGQVVIREDLEAETAHLKHIVVPYLGSKEEEQLRRTSHRGTVIALGPPARTRKNVDVPHGFAVGDVVMFVWTHLEKAWTREFDGEVLAWVPQSNVLAVVEMQS